MNIRRSALAATLVLTTVSVGAPGRPLSSPPQVQTVVKTVEAVTRMARAEAAMARLATTAPQVGRSTPSIQQYLAALTGLQALIGENREGPSPSRSYSQEEIEAVHRQILKLEDMRDRLDERLEALGAELEIILVAIQVREPDRWYGSRAESWKQLPFALPPDVNPAAVSRLARRLKEEASDLEQCENAITTIETEVRKTSFYELWQVTHAKIRAQPLTTVGPISPHALRDIARVLDLMVRHTRRIEPIRRRLTPFFSGRSDFPESSKVAIGIHEGEYYVATNYRGAIDIQLTDADSFARHFAWDRAKRPAIAKIAERILESDPIGGPLFGESPTVSPKYLRMARERIQFYVEERALERCPWLTLGDCERVSILSNNGESQATQVLRTGWKFSRVVRLGDHVFLKSITATTIRDAQKKLSQRIPSQRVIVSFFKDPDASAELARVFGPSFQGSPFESEDDVKKWMAQQTGKFVTALVHVEGGFIKFVPPHKPPKFMMRLDELQNLARLHGVTLFTPGCHTAYEQVAGGTVQHVFSPATARRVASTRDAKTYREIYERFVSKTASGPQVDVILDPSRDPGKLDLIRGYVIKNRVTIALAAIILSFISSETVEHESAPTGELKS